MAPETQDGSGRGYEHKADVYSLGVVSYELMSGRNLTAIPTSLGLEIARGNMLADLQERGGGSLFALYGSFVPLVERMVKQDPGERPDIEEVHSTVKQLQRALPRRSGGASPLPCLPLPARTLLSRCLQTAAWTSACTSPASRDERAGLGSHGAGDLL